MAAIIWDGAFVDIDALTMHTIVQMQLGDNEELAASAKGKQREDVKTDAQIAMEMYVEDLKNCDAYLQDRTMAQSLAMAILQDGDLIANAYKQEQQLAQDRQLAARLANGDQVPVAGPSGTQNEPTNNLQKKAQKDPWEDQEMLEKVAAIYMHMPEDPILQESTENDDDSDGTVAESSSWAASRIHTRKRPLRVCVACGEELDFFEVARVPCDHEYCKPCLKELFTLSMKDETLFPPRCDGQEVPLELVRFFLPSDVAKEFESKYDELSTQNRTYCHERSCTAFIPSELHVGDTCSCPKCGKTTCAICKGPSHSGDCPDDEALQQLIEAANVAQWQRCYQCTRFVELDSGCNHMRYVPSQRRLSIADSKAPDVNVAQISATYVERVGRLVLASSGMNNVSLAELLKSWTATPTAASFNLLVLLIISLLPVLLLPRRLSLVLRLHPAALGRKGPHLQLRNLTSWTLLGERWTDYLTQKKTASGPNRLLLVYLRTRHQPPVRHSSSLQMRRHLQRMPLATI